MKNEIYNKLVEVLLKITGIWFVRKHVRTKQFAKDLKIYLEVSKRRDALLLPVFLPELFGKPKISYLETSRLIEPLNLEYSEARTRLEKTEEKAKKAGVNIYKSSHYR